MVGHRPAIPAQIEWRGGWQTYFWHRAAGPPTDASCRPKQIARSRWSLIFVKFLTMLEVGSKRMMLNRRLFLIAVTVVAVSQSLCAGEPPAINPFGKTPSSEREDAVPGAIELSDGSVHSGMIYLTRDKRFQIYDEQLERQREIPLQAIKKIECTVKKEWMEKEWKFKEAANNEKMYTGRSYPAREYVHTITLKNGRTVTGSLSTIVYLQPQRPKATTSDDDSQSPTEPERFMLSKRNKGEFGKTLKSLVYVKRIKLDKDAKE
jgi:hypothetical protein